MAININQVYKSVLVVLQQQKRGVLTPTEFNKVATQAQQEIFNDYFDELNQMLRQPQTSLAYADRLALLDEKIQIFKRVETLSTNASSSVTPTSQVQELGEVVYFKIAESSGGEGRLVQRIQAYEVYTTNQSALTKPSELYPVYTYKNNVLKFYPETELSNGVANIKLNFLKYPTNVKWGFIIDTELGNYIYDSLSSTDFELHQSDQTLLIDKILGYAGVMTRDQLALQLASQKEQQIDIDGQK
tara:strand:- start:5078 stop:5809 length:732 start_codon:yes stop_codon:yes gene_type:complete